MPSTFSGAARTATRLSTSGRTTPNVTRMSSLTLPTLPSTATESGGLLLLPKSFNASYGDKPYAEKREHYFGQNLLAQSLHESAYDHNPGFRKFRDESGLSFKPHKEFKKADLDLRQELYREIAEQIWSPNNLRGEVVS